MIVRPQQHWLRRIFVWHGSVLSKISSRLLLNFLFSIAVIFMLPWYTHLGIKFTLAPFSILGVAIAIFLGFRNNAGYARYVEARKLWGQLMIASRSLLREVKTTLPDSASVREFARLQIAFAHCLRMTLRKQPQAEVLAHYLKTEDLQRVLASNSPANRILLIMGEWLAVQRRNGQLSDILFISLNDRLNDISAVLAGCERIAYTPIPFAYTLILHRTVYLFCIMLPFALVVDLHYMTPFISVLISYTFISLDCLAEELEDPFGTENNDLPLDAICNAIEIDLFQMSGQALGLQHIGQCLGVGLGVILVGTLTGAEDETVFLGLDQCQLVGDAVLLQVQQGRTAQHQIVVLDTPEAAQVVDAAHAHGTGKQVGAAQTAVHGLIGAQIHTGAPDLGALLGLV